MVIADWDELGIGKELLDLDLYDNYFIANVQQEQTPKNSIYIAIFDKILFG